MKSANGAAASFHAPLSKAWSFQGFPFNLRAKFRTVSSHRNHLPGLARSTFGLISSCCHCSSLQVVAFHSHSLHPALAEWPAQCHLLFAWAANQQRTPASLAIRLAFLVDSMIQSTQGWSGARLAPMIFRSIIFLALCSCCLSLTFRAHDSLHHRTELPTVASNKFNRFFSRNGLVAEYPFHCEEHLPPFRDSRCDFL